MEIAALIALIWLSLKPSFVRSTYPKEASIAEFGSGLNLDLTLAGIHEGKSAELNLDLSLGNEVYKSNKAPTANRLTSIRFTSNPLYFAEAGPSRSEYLSLGLGSGKNYVTSDTDSTKRSISQLDLQANFYLHAPHDTLDPEKHSGERIALGDSQNMRKIVTNNDGSSDVIERNHGTIHDNLPHKRKYMAENFPTEAGAQYQNFPHNPGLKSFETSTSSNEISHGKNLIAKDNEAQKIRISAGGSRPTKKQKVSNLETINIGRKYRTNGTLKTEEGIESEKIEIWKDVKVSEYKGFPLLKSWSSFDVKKKSNIKCLAEPYDNVLYFTPEDLNLLSKRIYTNKDCYKNKRPKLFSTNQRKAALRVNYKTHEDLFSSWKTEDSKKYFEALGKSWEADCVVRTVSVELCVGSVQFATSYTIERIGFMTKDNGFNIFVDIERAKEDAYEILKSYWKTLPLGKSLGGTWQGKNDEKATNIQLLNYLQSRNLNRGPIAGFGTETLLFALKHIIPIEYYQSLLITKKSKNNSPKNFIQKLNEIALNIAYQKVGENFEEKNLK